MTVAQLVSDNPSRGRVLTRHKIDFCIWGLRKLDEIRAERNIDVSAVLSECYATHDDNGHSILSSQTGSLIELAHFIESNYHSYGLDALPRAVELLQESSTHWSRQFPAQANIIALVTKLDLFLKDHSVLEEQMLFPLVEELESNICQTMQSRLSALIKLSQLERDHCEIIQVLKILRFLCNDFVAPDGEAHLVETLDLLEQIESNLHLHIHCESNVLFPRIRERLIGV